MIYCLLYKDKIDKLYNTQKWYSKELFNGLINNEIDIKCFIRNVNENYYDYISDLIKHFKQLKKYEDAVIKYRNNPNLLIEDMYGIKLKWYQKLMLNKINYKYNI